MTMRTQHATTIKLPLATRERIQNLAQARRRSPHALMLEAIESFVDREEKREAWRQEGLRAYEEYQLTGAHLTGDELDAWLARLEAGYDEDPPACHP
jgi:predicted transcriptional regulator